ncbi:MAG: hypothetical protein EB005_03485 [Actinobacteria bacterium]|nr:hypothetical protein [Actinomycetota bacterium]NDH36943.1 hypothetical protein [Acidimicrobiia bacterium]
MMLSELLTEFSLPAESVNEVAPTCTVAVPDAPVDGVKVAVYEFPDPAKSESAPPLTEIAPSTKSVELSESVNVRLAVSPAFNVPLPVRPTVTVGASVSIRTELADAADVGPVFVAASVTLLMASVATTVPSLVHSAVTEIVVPDDAEGLNVQPVAVPV